jgi:hypothetical protein
MTKKPPKPHAGMFQKGHNRGFQKGVSGNPGGKPKSIAEVVALARQITPKGLKRLEQILEDPNSSDMAAVAAFNAVADRAYGKAVAAVAIGEIGAALSGERGGADGLSTLLGVVRARKAIGYDGETKSVEQQIGDAVKVIADAARDGMDEAGLVKLIEQLRYVQAPIEATAKPVPTGRAKPADEDAAPASTSPSPAAETALAGTQRRATQTPPVAPTTPPETAPASKPSRAKPKHSGAPAGFGAFSEAKQSERDAEAARMERLKKLYPNGIPREVAFPANDGPGFQRPEINNVTRQPGTNGFRKITG